MFFAKNVKKIIVFLGFSIAVLGVSTAQQKTVLQPYLKPLLTAETPDWFKMLLVDDETKIDVAKLDKAAGVYMQQYKASHKDAAEGYKNKDNYIRYYLRWRLAADHFIKNGKIIFSSDADKIKLAEADKARLGITSNRVAKGAANWVAIGPFSSYRHDDSVNLNNYNTNIYSFAVAPSNTSILYASNETGALFKTTDKGLNWTMIGRNQSIGGGASSIAVHPTDPNTVVISKGGRLIKSTDGGVNFSLLKASFSPDKIIFHPSNASIMLAANGDGIYRSTDGGATWTQKLACGWASDIDFNPLNPNTVYAVGQNLTATKNIHYLYKSTDNGNTWVQKSANGYSVDSLGTGGGLVALSAADTNRVYVCYLAQRFPVLNKSLDGGNTWTYKAATGTGLSGSTGVAFGMANGQGYYDFVLEASQTNANHLITGTCSVWKSIDGGSTFKGFGGYANESGQPFSIHPDIQCSFTNGTDTWLSTDGGMVYSSDFFTTAANSPVRQKGINGINFWGFDVGWNEDLVVGGSYHNGNNAASPTEYGDKGLVLGGGESPTGYLFPGRRRHGAFDDIGGYILPERIGTGFQGNFTMNKYPNQDANQWNESNLINHPVYFNTLFLGKDSSLWKSTDGGLTFTQVYKFNSGVVRFVISRSNPNVMYLGKNMTAGNESLMKTTDGGVTWTKVSLPTTNTGISGTNLFIAIHPTDENKVWITDRNNSTSSSDATWGNQKIYYSTNGGTSWTNITPAIQLSDRSIRDICSDGGNGVYIVSNAGPDFGTGMVCLYSANSTGSDWVDHTSGLPKNLQAMRLKPFFKNGKLRMGTNTAGAWETDLYTTNPSPIAQPLIEKQTVECLRDSVQLDSYSILNQNGASWQWSVSPATASFSNATIRNPKIKFNAAGTYSITLTVTNSLGQSNSKTITNAVTVLNYNCNPDTLAGNALVTNTATDYAIQKQGIGINTNTITLSAWVKPNGTQASFAGIITSNNGGAVNLNLRDNNQLGYHWNNTSASYNWTGGPTLPANIWSHVALVIEPTKATIYLNGVASSNFNTHDSINLNQPFFVGTDRGFANRPFVGSIDEVAIYNKALTAAEVRTLMHLTKNNPNAGSLPTLDNSLKSYYQFNEGDTSATIYDRAGTCHLQKVGAAQLQASTAPVGGGTAALVNITAGGAVNFGSTGVQLTFPSTGTYPNGDVVVTRLNVPSSGAPSTTVIPNNPLSYYVINNFGTNASVSPLTAIKINNVTGITANMISNPSTVRLYKRPLYGEGNFSWGLGVETADSLGAVKANFGNGYSSTTFGQYSIGLDPVLKADTVPGAVIKMVSAGDYVKQNDAINISTNTITLSAWVKPNGNQVSYAGLITSSNGGGTSLNVRDNNQLGYHWNNGQYNWAGGPTLPINVWSHVALVVEPTKATIYLNGMPYTNTTAHTAVNFNQAFYMGIDRGNTSRNFKGLMDEVCIYNKALTATEVRTLMNLTKNNPNAGSMPAIDNNLLNYYQFNETATNVVYDKVGNIDAAKAGTTITDSISSAPVGGGNADQVSVTNGGAKIFTKSLVTMYFPATGTYPNGNVVVTKLNVEPNGSPAATTIFPTDTKGYYVVNNFGTNTTFTKLDSIDFKGIVGVPNTFVTNPRNIDLFKRKSVDEGNSWGTSFDISDAVTITNGSANVRFSNFLNLTSFSQFALAQTVIWPINITEFTATEKPNACVELKWIVGNATAANNFEIQKSKDGINFETIAIVQSQMKNTYTYVDEKTIVGSNFYRIKTIENTGVQQYSTIKKVEIKNAISIKVLPNPTSNGWVALSVNGLKKLTNFSILVVDVNGKLVKVLDWQNVTNNANKLINIGTKGNYVLKLISNNNEQFLEKIIVL